MATVELPDASDAPLRREAYAGRVQASLYTLASLLLLALAWQGVSWLVGADVLPPPIASVLAIGQSSADGYLWSDMAVTAYRILGAFAIALVVSIVGGALLGRVRMAERLLGPWVTIGASVPSLRHHRRRVSGARHQRPRGDGRHRLDRRALDDVCRMGRHARDQSRTAGDGARVRRAAPDDRAARRAAANDAVHLYRRAHRIGADLAHHDLRRARWDARPASATASNISTTW